MAKEFYDFAFEWGLDNDPEESIPSKPMMLTPVSGVINLEFNAATMADAAANQYRDSGKLLIEALPGLKTRVPKPCSCCKDTDGYRPMLIDTIMHLNDVAMWTRERIADWLDTLDIDLTFPVPDEIPTDVR